MHDTKTDEYFVHKSMEEGKKYMGKALSVAIKKYVETGPKSVIIYSEQYFAIFGFLELIQLCASCGHRSEEVPGFYSSESIAYKLGC
jgi:hypothetical protein